LISGWNNIRELQDEKGKLVAVKLPPIKVTTAPDFFDAMIAQKPQIPTIQGERPDVWLYIHGPSHQKAIKASREADILLPVAEKLATINAVIDGSFKNYPETQLAKAWEAKIYPDHGWGGKHGDITDALFLQKYEFSKAEASQIIAENLGQLAAKVITHPGKGRPLVVFNSMNAQRNDPVSVEISFGLNEATGVELRDAAGKKIDAQLSQAEYYANGSIKRASLCFIAEQVPSLGYTTYYLKTGSQEFAEAKSSFTRLIENQFYKLKFGNGGLSSIFDKTLNQELIDSTKFKAGEVFTLHSFGNGAGEFTDIQKTDMEGFDQTGKYPTQWEVEEDGPVYTVYKYRQHIRYADIEQRIKVYRQIRKIDFEPSVLNWEGVLYREFRMAIPLNMNDGQVAYEVPFGVVEVGKDELKGAAGERYQTICKDMHPRGIENWISASNTDFGVTLSSSVAVADWIDPTSNPMKNQMLQPILLASRKSCHWEGNDYLQTGDHTFRFSFTSHPSGWINGNLFGREANEQLFPVWADHQLTTASLPESLSFFSTDQEHVLISAIKKSEDTDETIIRLVDLEGKDKEVKLSCFKKIEKAAQTNLIETQIKTLPINGDGLTITLGHHAIETFSIKPSEKTK
jgi:alpha-mannosidase